MAVLKKLANIPVVIGSILLGIPMVIGMLFELIPLGVFGILLYKTRD